MSSFIKTAQRLKKLKKDTGATSAIDRFLDLGLWHSDIQDSDPQNRKEIFSIIAPHAFVMIGAHDDIVTTGAEIIGYEGGYKSEIVVFVFQKSCSFCIKYGSNVSDILADEFIGKSSVDICEKLRCHCSL